MHLKGTKKIRGVLILASVKAELGRGQTFPISDNDFWNQDVQIALQAGYAVAIGAPAEKLTTPSDPEEEDRLITCRNNYSRPLSLPGFDMEIGPNKKFSIKESQLNQADIRAAVSKNIISVVSSSTPAEFAEGTVSISAKRPEKVKAALPESQNPKIDYDKLTPAQRLLLNAVQKKHAPQPESETKHSQVNLETNEELRTTNVIDDENPPPVRKEDIPDTKRNAVVWNPTGAPVINVVKGAVVALGKQGFAKTSSATKTNLDGALRLNPDAEPSTVKTEEDNAPMHMPGQIPIRITDDPNPLPADPNEDDPRRRTVVVNPHGEKVSNTMKDAHVWTGQKEAAYQVTTVEKSVPEELTFVDKEQEDARYQKHPKLSQAPKPDQSEVVIISEADMRKPHPKLDQQDDIVEFVKDSSTRETTESA